MRRIGRRLALTGHHTTIITGSALARHSCKVYARISRKIGNSTPCKTVTPGNFSSKLYTRDYIRDGIYCANFGANRFSGGFSPNKWIVTYWWLFDRYVLSCPVLFSRARVQVEPLDRFSCFVAQTMCFRARRCRLGLEQQMTSFGENMPPNPLEVGVNRQFQVKMPRYENRTYLQSYKSDQAEIWR